MYHEAGEGNAARVNEAQKRVNALYKVIRITGGKIIPAIKAAAMLLGRSTQWMKIPGLALSEVEIAQVKNVLETLRLL